MTNPGEEADIVQKLIDLKAHQEQYDQANQAMRYAKNEAETLAYWHLTNETEKKYEEIIIWFETHKYTIKWNTVKQIYEAYKHNTP